jgi:hypothetical protein
VSQFDSNFIPNMAAPERAGGEYHGDPNASVWGGPVGMQPQGVNNPNGNVAGVAAMTITPELAYTLEGPQPDGMQAILPGT